MFEVTLANFQTDVVTLSQTTAVVLDFYSPRAPQCAALSESLATLELAYCGAFTLGSVNADLHPQIAQAFQIQSVPTTIVFVNGQPVDGFSGSLSEDGIRKVLDKHIQAIAPVDDRPPEVIYFAAAIDAHALNDLPLAIQNLQQALTIKPDFDAARLLLVQCLLDSEPDLARSELAQITASTLIETQQAQYAALDAKLNAASRAAQSPEILALQAKIAATPNDLSARLALSNALRDVNAFEPALEQALHIVKTDRAFGEDAGRKAMIALFGLASGSPELVRAWRQKLSAALN